jgi:GNAT superfamily N-acetyltransferase
MVTPSSAMIRRATIEDLAALAGLEKAAEDEGVIWGYHSQPADEWARRDLAWTWLAYDGGVAVGFLHAAPRPYDGECVLPPTSRTLEILDVFVAPASRNRGIGRELVAAVQRQARAEGFTHLRVYSSSKKFDDVVRFYRACGFSPWYLEMTQPLGESPGRRG